MEFINVQTSQNVAIGYEIAGLGDRYLAALIDYFIFFAYLLGVGLLIEALDAWRLFDAEIIYVVIIFLPLALYHPICEIIFDGQSIGKMARKIKVVKIDGTQVSIGSYLLRWLFRLVDILLTGGGLAVISIMITKNGQRLGDVVANTTVVSLKQQVELDDTLLFQPQEGYRPSYPEVRDLSDRDIATIKDTLLKAYALGNPDLLYVAYDKVTQVLNIHAKEHQTVEGFLETVVRDYNHFHTT